MKCYLSSYKFGNDSQKLETLLPKGSNIGHINNARDFTKADPEKRTKHQRNEIKQWNQLGYNSEPLDLQCFFGKENELRKKLQKLVEFGLVEEMHLF